MVASASKAAATTLATYRTRCDRFWVWIANGAWHLVGVGRLGQAILGYGGFEPQCFNVVKAYDFDAATIGRREGSIIVEDVADLERSLREAQIDIGIVAVPGQGAQQVIDVLVAGGVRAILNYAPIAVRVPAGVYVRQIDPVLSLQSMTYYLKHADDSMPADGDGANGALGSV